MRAYKNGKVYTGEWQLGAKHGNGSMNYPNGDKYEGAWVNDQRSGFGILRLHRGDVYEGEWRDDMQHGRGTLIHYEGTVYEGLWEFGKQVNQSGIYTNPNTNQKLKTSDYKLKENYRKPIEYLNNQDRVR